MSITTGPVLAEDAALRLRRRTAAVRWRCDHVDHPDRDRLWVMFRAFAVWRTRSVAERRPITLALDDAERIVAFTPLTVPCDVLVDLRRRCGRPAPCADHP